MSESQRHDALFKAVFARPTAARALLATTLPPSLVRILDLRTLRAMPTNLVSRGLRQRFADLLFSVRARNRRLFVHLLLEHRSDSRASTVIDVFSATGAAMLAWHREHPRATRFPIVLPIVLHHGRRPFAAPTRFQDALAGSAAFKESLRGFLPVFPITFVDLATSDDSIASSVATLDRVAGCATWLLQHALKPRFRERLAREPHFLREALLEPTPVDDLLRYTLLALEPSRRADQFLERFESSLGSRSNAMARNMLESLIEYGAARGRKEGRLEGQRLGQRLGQREGQREGQRLGSVKTLRNAILTVLRERFQRVPAGATTIVRGIESIAILEDLLARAASATSGDEFKTAAKKFARRKRG